MVAEVAEAVSWQRSLAQAIRDPDVLCDRLGLPDCFRPAARLAATQFPLLVPEAFLSRMRQGDPNDPLLLQVLPIGAEVAGDATASASTALFTIDPTGDAAARVVPGVLHKYEGRALLILSGACAIHCRYCFRRHYAYQEDPVSPAQWQPAFEYLQQDQSISEVLLSGGDPLTRTDDWLARFVGRLAEIPHLKRLRVHTRLPIVLPSRVTEGLIETLTANRLQPVMVVHCNHPRELDTATMAALRSLADAGVVMFNQSVLLRGINDNAATIAELCERLFSCRVVPYYLHQLDRVAGAAHFEVSEAEGAQIVSQLRQRLPGYLVPRYVREVPGADAKVPLA